MTTSNYAELKSYQPYRLKIGFGSEEQKNYEDINAGGYNHVRTHASFGYAMDYLFCDAFINYVSSDIKDLGSWKKQFGVNCGPRLSMFNTIALEPYVGTGFEWGEYNYGNTTIPAEDHFLSFIYGAQIVLSPKFDDLPISPLVFLGAGKESADTYETTRIFAGIGMTFSEPNVFKESEFSKCLHEFDRLRIKAASALQKLHDEYYGTALDVLKSDVSNSGTSKDNSFVLTVQEIKRLQDKIDLAMSDFLKIRESLQNHCSVDMPNINLGEIKIPKLDMKFSEMSGEFCDVRLEKIKKFLKNAPDELENMKIVKNKLTQIKTTLKDAVSRSHDMNVDCYPRFLPFVNDDPNVTLTNEIYPIHKNKKITSTHVSKILDLLLLSMKYNDRMLVVETYSNVTGDYKHNEWLANARLASIVQYLTLEKTGLFEKYKDQIPACVYDKLVPTKGKNEHLGNRICTPIVLTPNGKLKKVDYKIGGVMINPKEFKEETHMTRYVLNPNRICIAKANAATHEFTDVQKSRLRESLPENSRTSDSSLPNFRSARLKLITREECDAYRKPNVIGELMTRDGLSEMKK